jgi:NAD(P)H-hydrate epimerase
VVLKGANTVIAAPDGRLLRSAVATSALATAGSGDVLAGAIGAMLAAGLPPLEAAAVGVAVHAAAGLLAEQRIGSAGVLATDVARLLPETFTLLRGREAKR